LTHNLKANKITNYQAYNLGLYNEETRVSVEQHHNYNTGCYYVKKDPNGTVMCQRLDDQPVTQVDFIKIDTEGAELAVLQGSNNVLDQWHPLVEVEYNGLSDELYQTTQKDLFKFLFDKGYLLFGQCGPNFYFYCPNVSLNVIPHNIFCFWTGQNQMSEKRQQAIQTTEKTTQCHLVLVKQENLSDYLLPSQPLHPAYQYLSETHRADYLRTYFMHFYGGGYTDIKMQTGSWCQAFDIVINNGDCWVCGYPEVDRNGVAYVPIMDHWEKLVGNGAYICRPNTSLTREWYESMLALLDAKLPELQAHPSTFPQDCKETGSGYPIEWNEMLGRIFQRVAFAQIEHVVQSLPTPIFTDYR
jgi:hypothetical protein